MKTESPAERSECTLAIIKPDAVERRLIGAILQRIEDADFTVRPMLHCRTFYGVIPVVNLVYEIIEFALGCVPAANSLN